MFDWVHNNRRLIQILLFLFLLPFVFVGVDTYFRGSELGAEVARVGDARISQQEFQQGLRERQEQVQRMLGGGRLDPEMLDSPEMRFSALEQIIRERLLLQQAVRAGVVLPDAALRDVIANEPAFQEDGRFSKARYDAFLRSQNLSDVAFEARLRRQLLQQPLLDAFGESGFVSRTVADRLIRLSEQRREISVHTVVADGFAARVQIDDAAVKAYFDANQAEFRVPEQVRVEYVALSLDNLAAQTAIGPDDARRVYEQNAGRFSQPEEREAAHILVRVPQDANAEVRAAARTRVEEILKQVRAKPAAFAEVARARSEDPGSAGEGGSLGFLQRGATKKPFDDALFRMTPGEIAGPVETEFGYHVIRLGEVRGGRVATFEEVRGQIETDLRRQQASKTFAELSEKLANVAYEQSDSLKPAAELLKAGIQQSPWLSRKPAPGSPLGGERFLNAVFSEDVLKNSRNSEPVEVAPGTLLVARLLEHKPSAVRPFEEVAAAIRARLIRDEAGKLAAQEGRALIERLKKGEDAGVAWGKPQLIGRGGASGFAEAVVRQAFRADASSVPAFVGAEEPGRGFHVVRVSRVEEPQKPTPEMQKAVIDQLRQYVAQEQLTGYVAQLKADAGVRIKPGVVEKKQ